MKKNTTIPFTNPAFSNRVGQVKLLSLCSAVPVPPLAIDDAPWGSLFSS